MKSKIEITHKTKLFVFSNINRITKPKMNFFNCHQVTQFLNNEAKGTKVIGATSLQDMVNKLKTPRKIMMLVKGTWYTLQFMPSPIFHS